MPSKSLSKRQSEAVDSGFLASLGINQPDIQLNETAKVMIELMGEVMLDAERNLNNINGVSSGKLITELEQEITIEPGLYQTILKMLDYGFYQDEGVNGTKQARGSRFQFKSKRPSKKFMESIRKWALRENLSARTFNRKLGKETKSGVGSNQAAAYAIATAILQKGIEPKKFMTKAVDKLEQKMANGISEAFRIDVVRAIEGL